MSGPVFHRSPRLDALGVDHGLGTRRSEDASLAPLSLARQIHGRDLVRAPAGTGARADALWTSQPGLAVGVRTADCVPILLVDERRRAVAVIHAGWRGSARGITRHVVSMLDSDPGIDPRSWLVVIGPCIGPCCYEVDGPVRDAIAEAAVFAPSDRAERYRLDLERLNRLQLERAGVRPERIERVGGCTACMPNVYASYRRDGTAGRMLHYVRMPPS